MNLFEFIEVHAVATIPIGYMAGWAAGLILWLARYMMMELPRAGKLKGGEKYL